MMRSTGEVLGMADSFGLAYYRAPYLTTLAAAAAAAKGIDAGKKGKAKVNPLQSYHEDLK